MNKFKFIILIFSFVLSAFNAFAQPGNWPLKPITLVVPFAAGGSTDITARMLAEKLTVVLGQSVVVDNKAGAAGNIAGAYVSRAAPDGYTIMLNTSTMTANVTLYKDMGFNPQKDLTPISQIALIPNVLMVNSDFQAKTLDKFIEIA